MRHHVPKPAPEAARAEAPIRHSRQRLSLDRPVPHPMMPTVPVELFRIRETLHAPYRAIPQGSTVTGPTPRLPCRQDAKLRQQSWTQGQMREGLASDDAAVDPGVNASALHARPRHLTKRREPGSPSAACHHVPKPVSEAARAEAPIRHRNPPQDRSDSMRQYWTTLGFPLPHPARYRTFQSQCPARHPRNRWRMK